ncbi:MAG: phosphoribosyltransferase [Pirellula sp.]|nr:phosphoribosyltransferase [Pirellula sp.]
MTTISAAAETRQVLVDCQALLADDHFVYISGDHGSGWVDKDAIFVDPQRIRRLTQLLAAAVKQFNAEILCGPATGGLIVAQWTAFELGLPAVFAEHTQPRSAQQLRGDFTFHRGYDRLVAGKRVLVVDDVVNTGLSVRQTAAAVRQAGGEVIAIAALVDRGNVDAESLGVPDYVYLLEYDIPDWSAADCPLCKAGVPINTRYAHGQDFLDAQQQRAADA